MSQGETHDIELCDAGLTQVFEILGKRWNGIILGSLSAGPASFSRLARGVT